MDGQLSRRAMMGGALGVLTAGAVGLAGGAPAAFAATRPAASGATGLPIYFPNMSDSSMSALDPAAHTVLSTAKVGDHPLIVRTTKDGRKSYADNVGLVPGTLTSIDHVTGKKVTITLDGVPFAIVFSPDDTLLYALKPNASIDVVEVATDKVLRTMKIPVSFDIPAGFEISPDGRTLYYSTAVGSQLFAIDSATGAATKPGISVGGMGPLWLAISRDGTRVYSFNWYADTTTVFDTRTWKQIATIDNGKGAKPAVGLETPDGSTLYITNFATSNVQAVDTRTWKTTGRITTTGLPMGISFSKDGLGWITDWGPGSSAFADPFISQGIFIGVSAGGGTLVNLGPGTLSSFDPATNQVLSRTTVGSAPAIFDAGA